MFKVAFILFLVALAPLTLAHPVMAEDDDYTSSFSKRAVKFNDSYKGSDYLCRNDCARQDRIKEVEPSRPYELKNSFDNGRKGKSVSGIISNQLEPSSGR